ncbi:unnamed protein product, partial [Polarella glacialis]
MGDEATAYEKAFAPIQREKSASDDSSRAAPDLPAYALRVVPPSRGGGGLFFLRGEKRDILSTGKGGGFNDRTIADKVEHNSDDELIDEFGRKKKKRKTAAPKSGEKAAAKESKPLEAEAGRSWGAAPEVSASFEGGGDQTSGCSGQSAYGQ